MTPDAIVIFVAGIVPRLEGGWRSTTYDESDTFGTLGGRDRIEAAALLAKQHPDAYVVMTSQKPESAVPNVSEVYAGELRALGVGQERIIEKENQNTTQSALQAALQLAGEREWTRLLFVSSGFHIPRIRAFFEQEHSTVTVEFVASEQVIEVADPGFAGRFAAIQQTASYQKRLAAEERGIEALRLGAYRSAPTEDKKERTA